MLEAFQPSSVPPPGGPYTAGIKMGNLLFLSGQGPFTADGELVTGGFRAQVHATFKNLDNMARAAGTSLDNAVRINAYLSTLNFFDEFNEVMAEYVSVPFPARTTIPVDLHGFDVEIDAILAVPDGV